MEKNPIVAFLARTLNDVKRTALAFLLATPLFFLCLVAVNAFYTEVLCEYFPELFRVYSKITDEQSYDAMMRGLNMASALLTLFVDSWLVTVYNPFKLDDVFKHTQGFYRLGGGWRIYFRSYALSDLAAIILTNAVFCAASVFIPNTVGVFDLTFLMQIYEAILAVFPPALGAAVAVGVMLLAKPLAIFFAVRRWRAELLSHLQEI